MSFTPTPAELKAGQFSPETLFLAINAFHRDGFLVIEGVEDVELFKKISDYMIPEREEIEKGTHKAEELQKTRNFLHGPPSHVAELDSHKLYKNPFVLQVLNAYLGARPQFMYTCGNNAGKKGTARQKVHTDCRYNHPVAPYMVAAQWVLCDFTPETGATEVWPGSHLHTSPADHIHDPTMQMWLSDEVVEARRKTHPPTQVRCKVGGVFLRDMRLWHAGMPNLSDHDRIMLACGYTARWFHCRGTVKAGLLMSVGEKVEADSQLPYGVEHLYESTDQVEVMSKFMPLEEYLTYRNVIVNDFSQTSLILPDAMGRNEEFDGQLTTM